jgi:hypothetical protein
MLAAVIAVAASALGTPCLAQETPADQPATEAAKTEHDQAAPTKEALVKQLGEIKKTLQGLQKSLEPEAAPQAPLAREERERGERALKVRSQLDELEGIDTEKLLAAPERVAPAESGVDRLQRHQRELTTQKLGDQLIILDENP